MITCQTCGGVGEASHELLDKDGHPFIAVEDKASLRQPPEIFVEGTPRSHYTVNTPWSRPEGMGETILRIVGEALQAEGVNFQVVTFEELPRSPNFPARVRFGIRLNGKDL